ncbi:hypothetical protein EAF04_010244 [Stromatinia cepivora]|nr:hypothetical protein EAF04_010244 [Stromatinia cepivora]
MTDEPGQRSTQRDPHRSLKNYNVLIHQSNKFGHCMACDNAARDLKDRYAGGTHEARDAIPEPASVDTGPRSGHRSSSLENPDSVSTNEDRVRTRVNSLMDDLVEPHSSPDYDARRPDSESLARMDFRPCQIFLSNYLSLVPADGWQQFRLRSGLDKKENLERFICPASQN